MSTMSGNEVVWCVFGVYLVCLIWGSGIIRGQRVYNKARRTQIWR